MALKYDFKEKVKELKVMFGYIINKSFYTFIEMLNIYLKNYKEIEDGEVKFQF